MPFTIKPATTIANRILMALAGPQSSGKTTSALRLATGIVSVTGGKILIIDTEAKRALRYAESFKFNHLELDAPFSPGNYDDAYKYAEAQGYGEGDVIIIDSMTHEHEGPGGVLEMHEDFIDMKTDNSQNFRERDKYNLMGWNHAKKGRKRFIYFTLQRTKCHVILCFRAKEKVEQVKVNGKSEYVKSGLQPIGGEEYFFEMDITMVLPMGSQGKPDWEEKAARINEYGDKSPIRDLFKNTTQLSEETGAVLAKISAVKPADGPETIEQKTRRLVKEVIAEIELADDSGALVTVMDDNADKLKEIKDASQAARDHVNVEYDKKRIALGG